MKIRSLLYCAALAFIVPCGSASCAPVVSQQPVQVGQSPGGGYTIPTSQLVRPAGKSVLFGGRPVDIILSRDGKTVYAKDNGGLVIADATNWKIRKQITFPEGGSSMHGMALTKNGSHLYVTTAGSLLWEANISSDGDLSWGRKIALPGLDNTPCLWGIALSSDDKTAYVCLSRNNSLAVVDLVTGKLLKEIPVGIAPYDVEISADGRRAYVSNWGGRHPLKGERTAKSAGTDTLVDERGVGSSGTVSVVDLSLGRELSQVKVGLHPADLKLRADGRALYVANANSDTVSVIDVKAWKVAETIQVHPHQSLPFGSAPNALTLSKDSKTLYVANAGNNALAVVELRGGKRTSSVVKGFIPTAWYPGAVITDGRYLYVANVKGFGSRGGGSDAVKRDVYQHQGTLSKIAIPSDSLLKKYTAQVYKDARVPQILRALERKKTLKKPIPVPKYIDEPSVFEHVVYIIKENKTYDQMFGDMPKGNNDPSLCIFGNEVSPNHHALAEQFVLLDNYYCNGVCSADGHSWTTEGNVTDYLEKSFGGTTRSYTFGDDSLTYSSSGLIWDNVIEHGLSFRNYGEMDYATPVPSASWNEIYQDYLAKSGHITFSQSIGIDRLRRYSCPQYPGWNMDIPDVLRADVFLRELKEFDKKGEWPNFVIVYLPDDHTSGGAAGVPTPRAQVADNDLALGRVVEGISKSRFWPKTCIFVVEDDPQSGFDHVDGHRSPCLVISPYTKRGALISEFYNQTSVLRTMEHILGIPPMNQLDAMAPLMKECFTDKPVLTPYTCLPNRIALDEITKTAALYGDSLYMVGANAKKLLSRPDMIDDDKFNRAVWASVKGNYVPYPAHFAGAHGKGLQALHLALAIGDEDEDDDD